MTSERLGTLRFAPADGGQPPPAGGGRPGGPDRSEANVRRVRVMRRSGNRRRRWMRNLRHLAMEQRFAATLMSFGLIGAVAGLWLLWPQDDRQVREQQALWQQSLQTPALGEPQGTADPSGEAGGRQDPGPASIQSAGLPPAIARSLAVSAKERSDAGVLAAASPEPARPGPSPSKPSRPVVAAAPEPALPEESLAGGAPPEIGATADVAGREDAPVLAALPERTAPEAPDAAPAPSDETRTEDQARPEVDLASLPVLRPPVPPAIGDATPAWLRNAVARPTLEDRPAIAVVLDDLGMNRANTAALNEIEGPLTLAFLPYAGALERQTAAARAAGHELLVHVPMEPLGQEWPGPGALTTALDDAEILRRLRSQLDSFEGFVGINNHMGSRLTADRERMALVMAELREDGLLYLDSRTSGASVAAAEAGRLGVPHAVRDVFLDNEADAPYIDRRLAEVERIARRHGVAVAIGHPHDATLAALRRWLPTLEARGFELVPISTVVARRACADGLVAEFCGSLHLAAREVEPAAGPEVPTPARFAHP